MFAINLALPVCSFCSLAMWLGCVVFCSWKFFWLEIVRIKECAGIRIRALKGQWGEEDFCLLRFRHAVCWQDYYRLSNNFFYLFWASSSSSKTAAVFTQILVILLAVNISLKNSWFIVIFLSIGFEKDE